MRTTPLILAVFAAPVPAQPTGPPPSPVPVPAAAEQDAARVRVVDSLVALMVERSGDRCDELVTRLIAVAKATPAPPAKYLLLQAARRTARTAGSLAATGWADGALSEAFRVDPFTTRMETLAALEGRRSIPLPALAASCFQLAADQVEAIDDRDLRSAAELGRQLIERHGDPLLTATFAAHREAMQARRNAFLALADEPRGGAAHGRYLCFHCGDWGRGLPLLTADEVPAVARMAAEKGGAAMDSIDCLRRAEFWRSRTADAVDDTVREHMLRRALLWYGCAFRLLEDPERTRALQQMARIEDQLTQTPGAGHLDFSAPELLHAMVIDGGQWRVEDGRLYGRNLGPATRAVHRYAYSRIDSVLIRGGISSSDGLNFRLAVGPLNVAFNWEVRPENHFYAGDRCVTSEPRALQPGAEHEIRIRQLGANAAVFLDGQLLFEAPCMLHGTVCVYPALGSEIFVSELRIDGDLDLDVEVRGPSGAAR